MQSAQVVPAEAVQYRYIGKPVKVREDLPLLAGRGIYTDDVKLPAKIHHLAFLRSPYAHARIKRVDGSRALKLGKVKSVFTGEELHDINLVYWVHAANAKEPERHPLAVNKVKYHGEPLAAVVAEDPYTAEDALEMIDVDYEPLPAIVDPLRALEDGSIRVYDELPDNVLFSRKYESDRGALERINSSPVIIEEVFRNGRTSPNPLEPKCFLAYYDDDRLTIWATTQQPHALRTYLAECLSFPENKIRVIAPNVGGGFGVKETADEAVALCAIVLKLKVPIKWVETRTEHILATGHERDQMHRVRAGFTKEGRLVGIHDQVIADCGSGGQWRSEYRMVMTTVGQIPGPYDFHDYVYDLKVVMTNKAPYSPNVGYGVPVAAFVIERVMDIAAERLGLDKAEIRRVNLIGKDRCPYRNAAGTVYDSGNYQAALDLLLRMMNYQDLRRKQSKPRNEEDKLLGIGIGFYVKANSHSTTAQQNAGAEVGGYEKAVVKINPTGKVTVSIGVADQGQSHGTIFAQIAAEELGAKLEDVDIIEGDTDETPYGFGAHADRSTVSVGNAVILASKKLRMKVRRIAAHLLNSETEQIRIEDSVAYVRGQEERKISLGELAKIAYRVSTKLPPGEEPQLEEYAIFDPPTNPNVVSYGIHGAVVEVDRHTGAIEVGKYYVVDDAGVIVNTLTTAGQIHGTVVSQGFLQTFNELKYDENGILLSNSFMDYSPPTAVESPKEFILQHIESPGPPPGGFKGVGEGGAVGSPATLMNAIADAVATLGAKVTKVPISFNELYALFG